MRATTTTSTERLEEDATIVKKGKKLLLSIFPLMIHERRTKEAVIPIHTQTEAGESCNLLGNKGEIFEGAAEHIIIPSA